jgi:hypothetical protein
LMSRGPRLTASTIRHQHESVISNFEFESGCNLRTGCRPFIPGAPVQEPIAAPMLFTPVMRWFATGPLDRSDKDDQIEVEQPRPVEKQTDRLSDGYRAPELSFRAQPWACA